MVTEIAQRIEMKPFEAARLERLSATDRNDELTRIGMRFMRTNNLMRWDGFDLEFAADIAGRLYAAALAKIARANTIRTAA